MIIVLLIFRELKNANSLDSCNLFLKTCQNYQNIHKERFFFLTTEYCPKNTFQKGGGSGILNHES